MNINPNSIEERIYTYKHQNGKKDEVVCFWKAFEHEMKIVKELNFWSLPFSLAAIPTPGKYLLYFFFFFIQANIYYTFLSWDQNDHVSDT